MFAEIYSLMVSASVVNAASFFCAEESGKTLKTRNSKPDIGSDLESLGRGRRIRTLNKGFGDPRVTITPFPYATGILYRMRGALSTVFL